MIENPETQKEKIAGAESEQTEEQMLEFNRMLQRDDSAWPAIKKLAE